MNPLVNIGEIWINTKHGTRYRVVLISSHTEENYDLVSYKSAAPCHATSANKIHSRPYDLFLEKFTKETP